MMCEQIWRQDKYESVILRKSERPCVALLISWMRPICDYPNVVLWTALYKIYLTLQMRMKPLSVWHSNKSYWAVLPCSTSDYVLIRLLKWELLSTTFKWYGLSVDSLENWLLQTFVIVYLQNYLITCLWMSCSSSLEGSRNWVPRTHEEWFCHKERTQSDWPRPACSWMESASRTWTATGASFGLRQVNSPSPKRHVLQLVYSCEAYARLPAAVWKRTAFFPTRHSLRVEERKMDSRDNWGNWKLVQ